MSIASVNRTRRAHRITASILYKLLKAAYADYCEQVDRQSGEELSFDDWCEEHKIDSPQHQFFDLALSIELVVLSLICAFRELCAARHWRDWHQTCLSIIMSRAQVGVLCIYGICYHRTENLQLPRGLIRGKRVFEACFDSNRKSRVCGTPLPVTVV